MTPSRRHRAAHDRTHGAAAFVDEQSSARGALDLLRLQVYVAGQSTGRSHPSARRLGACHRFGDRALVPRLIRFVATPRGWIVAEAGADRRVGSRAKQSCGSQLCRSAARARNATARRCRVTRPLLRLRCRGASRPPARALRTSPSGPLPARGGPSRGPRTGRRAGRPVRATSGSRRR